LWEILLELLEFLGFIGLKKKKKKEKELVSFETKDSTRKQDTSEPTRRQSGTTCKGCHRNLERDAVYERGKTWCTECYKVHVLKIKS
jgi:protein-arginine kinase activator protein McsA